MIEKIQILNFQKHGKQQIKLSPGLNCITGPSDAGKSSILRALMWPATNKPAGSAFVKQGAKECAVRVQLEDNTVTRTRSKENSYTLNGTRLVSFGAGVPEGVEAAFNISDVNYQAQHDSPFWLTLNPGQAAAALNQLSGLDKTDVAMTRLRTAQKRAKAGTEVHMQIIRDGKAKLKDLSWVQDAVDDFEYLLHLETKIKGLLLERARLEPAYGRWQQATVRATEAQTEKARAGALLDIINELVDAKRLLDKLLTAQGNLRTCALKADAARAECERLQTAFDKIKVCPTCKRPL